MLLRPTPRGIHKDVYHPLKVDLVGWVSTGTTTVTLSRNGANGNCRFAASDGGGLATPLRHIFERGFYVYGSMGDVRRGPCDGGDHLWYASVKFPCQSVHVRICSRDGHGGIFDDVRADDGTEAVVGDDDGYDHPELRNVEFYHGSNQNRWSVRRELCRYNNLRTRRRQWRERGSARCANGRLHVRYCCQRRQDMLLQ